MSEPICTKWVLNYLLAQVKRLRNQAHCTCPEYWNAFIVPDLEQKLLLDECIFKKALMGGTSGNLLEAVKQLPSGVWTLSSILLVLDWARW